MAYCKISHFNSRPFLLDFTWNCCRLLKVKKFSRKPGHFKWVAKETRCRISIGELMRRNLRNQFAKLFWRPRAMLKILGTTNFSKIHRGKSFFMTGIENFLIYWPGRHNLSKGGTFRKIMNLGSHRGTAHWATNYWPGKLPGNLGRVFWCFLKVH